MIYSYLWCADLLLPVLLVGGAHAVPAVHRHVRRCHVRGHRGCRIRLQAKVIAQRILVKRYTI